MEIVYTVYNSAGKNIEDSTGWSNKWEENTNIAGEAIGLYQLLKKIRDNTKYLESGSINIFNNCSKVMNQIEVGFIKATDGIQDRSNIILQYIEILDKRMIEVYFDLVEGHLKGKCTYAENSNSVLIRKCDKLAKAARIKAKIEQIENINGISENALLVNGVVNDRIVGELIRMIDAKNIEMEYLKHKFLIKWRLIDSKARALFSSRAINSILKIVYRYNHYGTRNTSINKVGVNNDCLQCIEKES